MTFVVCLRKTFDALYGVISLHAVVALEDFVVLGIIPDSSRANGAGTGVGNLACQIDFQSRVMVLILDYFPEFFGLCVEVLAEGVGLFDDALNFFFKFLPQFWREGTKVICVLTLCRFIDIFDVISVDVVLHAKY